MGQAVGISIQLMVAAAADSAGLPPVTPWVVEYAASMCVLSRGFGGTAKAPAASLALRPLPLGTGAEMVVATSPTSSAMSRRGKVAVTLLPSGERQQVSFDRWRNATTQRTMMSFDVPADLLEAMRQAEGVQFIVDREPPIRLATGSTTKALAALVPCQDDLLRTWGYDPAIKDRIGTPAAPANGSVGSWFNRDYYPAEAVRLRQEGRTTVAWTINADGRTRDCRILGSSGVEVLDLTTCAIILQRARYKPALDRDGKPMVTYQVQAIRWSLND